MNTIKWNLQGKDWNWNHSVIPSDIFYPKTPQDAITMANDGNTIEVIGSAEKMVSRMFESIGIKCWIQYNKNRKGYSTFTPF